MRNEKEILADAFRTLTDDCDNTQIEVFAKKIQITRDDIHDGKPIIGIHYGGKLVQYWVTDNDISRLERLINEY